MREFIDVVEAASVSPPLKLPSLSFPQRSFLRPRAGATAT